MTGLPAKAALFFFGISVKRKCCCFTFIDRSRGICKIYDNRIKKLFDTIQSHGDDI